MQQACCRLLSRLQTPEQAPEQNADFENAVFEKVSAAWFQAAQQNVIRMVIS